jgi:hypothetical protein
VNHSHYRVTRILKKEHSQLERRDKTATGSEASLKQKEKGAIPANVLQHTAAICAMLT